MHVVVMMNYIDALKLLDFRSCININPRFQSRKNDRNKTNKQLSMGRVEIDRGLIGILGKAGIDKPLFAGEAKCACYIKTMEL